MRTANLAIVFTDIKGFTERTSRQTHAENQRMLRIHDALLAPVFKAFGGRQVKTIGDSFLVVFDSPTKAVLCGIAIQDRLWDYNRQVPEPEQIHVRVAGNMGEVRLEKGDVFGEPVNIAARIEGLADAGEVLFSESIYLAMNKAQVPARERGLFELKGIPEKVKVYEVPRGDYRLAATTPPTGSAPEPPEDTPGAGPPFGGIALASIPDLAAPDPERLASGGEIAAHLGAAASGVKGHATAWTRLAGEHALTLGDRLRGLPTRVRTGAAMGAAGLVLILALGAVLLADPIERAIDGGRLDEAQAAIGALEASPRRTYYEGRLREAGERWGPATHRYAQAARAGDDRAFDRLRDLTRHDTCRAREAAARALGRLGDRRALRALRRLEGADLEDEGGKDVLGAIFGCHSRGAARDAIRALEAE